MAKRRKKVKREPNGRASRRKSDVEWRQSESERDVMATAISARSRIFGITKEQARDQRAATVIGRMRILGSLSEPQYDALVKYHELRRDHAKAILSRTDGGPAGDRLASGDDAEYTDWCNRVKDRHDAMMGAVRDVSCEHRGANLYAALAYMVERDEHHEHMEGDLRLAANALARFFVIAARAAA